MKDRELPFQRIKTGVVAKWPLRAHFIQVDVALQHNLRVGRHFQIVGLAGHHFHRLAPQEAGKHHLVEVRRNRQHPCQPRFRIPREYQRECDEASGILRPAFQNREVKKVDVASLLYDFLARAGLHALRKKRSKLRELWQHLDLVEESLRRIHLQKSLDALRDFAQLLYFERQRHPPHASKRVDQQRMPRPFRLLEEQRRVVSWWDRHSCLSAFFAPHDPLYHFRNLQNRVHFRANPPQLPFFLQLLDKLPQVRVRHSFLPVAQASACAYRSHIELCTL